MSAPSLAPLSSSTPPATNLSWLPPPAYTVLLYGWKLYRLLPEPPCSHSTAYSRIYTPVNAYSAQTVAYSKLCCYACGGQHFTQDCTSGDDGLRPLDVVQHWQELAAFWHHCEAFATVREQRLQREGGLPMTAVHQSYQPKLAAFVPTPLVPPPLPSSPVPERVIPRTADPVTTNRFAPLLSSDKVPVVDLPSVPVTSAPAVALPSPLVQSVHCPVA